MSVIDHHAYSVHCDYPGCARKSHEDADYLPGSVQDARLEAEMDSEFRYIDGKDYCDLHWHSGDDGAVADRYTPTGML